MYISKQANLSLARKHAFFLDSGTSTDCWFKHIVEMPFFVSSELSEGIQEADLCSISGGLAGLFHKADVIITTSPQFFVNFSGYALGKLKGKPWFFELRDLWPESIRTVGAMKEPHVSG